MSGVICDRRVPARVKGKVYRVAVRPAMLYGLETVTLTKRQEAEMEVAELKMLRFSLGVIRMDKIRNEYIRGTMQVGRFGEKTREARLRWFGYVRKKDTGWVYWRKDAEDGTARRYLDAVRANMAVVDVTEGMENPLCRWPLMGEAKRRRIWGFIGRRPVSLFKFLYFSTSDDILLIKPTYLSIFINTS